MAPTLVVVGFVDTCGGASARAVDALCTSYATSSAAKEAPSLTSSTDSMSSWQMVPPSTSTALLARQEMTAGSSTNAAVALVCRVASLVPEDLAGADESTAFTDPNQDAACLASEVARQVVSYVASMGQDDVSVVLACATHMGVKQKPTKVRLGDQNHGCAYEVARALRDPTFAAVAHVLRSANVPVVACIAPGHAPSPGQTHDVEATDVLTRMLGEELGVDVTKGTTTAVTAQATYGKPVRLARLARESSSMYS